MSLDNTSILPPLPVEDDEAKRKRLAGQQKPIVPQVAPGTVAPVSPQATPVASGVMKSAAESVTPPPAMATPVNLPAVGNKIGVSPEVQAAQQHLQEAQAKATQHHSLVRKIFEGVGSMLAPGLMMAIPGTILNSYWERNQAQHGLNSATENALREANTEKITNPPASEPTNDFELWHQQNPQGTAEQWLQTQAGAKPPQPPKVNEISGIPVSITDGKGHEYSISDPNLPPELKPLADQATAAHKQHVTETGTPKYNADQQAYAKKLGKDPDAVSYDEWKVFERDHKQNLTVNVNGSNTPQGEAGAALKGVPKNLIPHATSDAQKAGEEYIGAAQAADDMHTFIQEARKGNKIAYAYSPVEGVLTLNTGRGVKRVNMAEIESYAGAGSGIDRITGFFGKQTSGASIPPDVLNDMESIHARIADNAKTGYERKLKLINHTYGSNFQPLDMGSGEQPVAPPTQQPQGKWNPQSGRYE